MTDDKSTPDVSERKRINVNDVDELGQWCEMFGVTPEQLLEAIKEVGDQADAVWQHLRTARRS
jgi:hypothetical protein